MGIVGLRYVGLPLVVSFAQGGAEVIALDTDNEKIDALGRCESYVPEVPDLGLQSVELEAALAEAEFVVIVTAHPGIEHAALGEHAPVLDFRGVLRSSALQAATSC